MTRLELKPFKDIEEQINILTDRNLSIRSRSLVAHYLKTVGYYRLSNYLYHFREYPRPSNGDPSLEYYRKGFFIEDGIDLYTFDQKLRALALEGTLEVNRAFGVFLGYHLASASPDIRDFDRGGYREDLTGKQHEDIRNMERRALKNNVDDPPIAHHIDNYSSAVPVWVLVNYFEFADLIYLYDYTTSKIKQAISNDMGFQDFNNTAMFLNLIRALRNICAHNGRLYDQRITVNSVEQKSESNEDDKTVKSLKVIKFRPRTGTGDASSMNGLRLDGNIITTEGKIDVEEITAFGALSMLSYILENIEWVGYKEWRKKLTSLMTETEFSFIDIQEQLGIISVHHSKVTDPQNHIDRQKAIRDQLAHRFWNKH